VSTIAASVPVSKRFPDFIGIGAGKSGTTWLYSNLSHHPDVWMPPVKEVQYFNELYIPGHRDWTGEHRRLHAGRIIINQVRDRSVEQLNFDRLMQLIDFAAGQPDDDWYGRIFSRAPYNKICGEITPEYCLLPHAGISHLLNLNRRVRLILILRDPIERTWSHIRMILRRSAGNDTVTPRRIWELPDVPWRSKYDEILTRWKNHCRTEDLLVGFLTDSVMFLQEVCKFLHLNFEARFFPRATELVHVGQQEPLPEDLYAELRAYYEPVYRYMAREFPDPCRQWLDKHFG
jgi:hypothetical protein